MLDAPGVQSPPSPGVQWAWTEMPRPSISTGTSGRPSASTCVDDAHVASMPLPKAAAKRLGIVEAEESVGLQRKRFGFVKRV